MSVKRICLAQIAGAHGVKGLVKLRCFTQDPAQVGAYGELTDEKGENPCRVTVRGCSGASMVIASLSDIADRTQALAEKGRRLYVDRAALPAPEEDSFYHADLIGLAVRDTSGTELGQVKSVQDFGAGTLLEIVMSAPTPTLWLPFRDPVIVSVDLDHGLLTVDPPTPVDASPEPSPASQKEVL